MNTEGDFVAATWELHSRLTTKEQLIFPWPNSFLGPSVGNDDVHWVSVSLAMTDRPHIAKETHPNEEGFLVWERRLPSIERASTHLYKRTKPPKNSS